MSTTTQPVKETKRRGPKPAAEKKPAVKKADKEKTVDAHSILQQATAAEPEVSPLEIIRRASLPKNIKSDEEFEHSLNPIDESGEQDEEAFDDDLDLNEDLQQQPAKRSERLPGVATRKPHEKQRPQPRQESLPLEADNIESMDGDLTEDIPEAPRVRKVVIKKIPKQMFRLGLEKTKENLQMLPGTAHGWVCDKRGDEYLTGFDSGLYEADRKRLEKDLRVNLSSKSAFWGTLNFRMEDKEHGQMLNFDDPKMGAYNEVVYFGMLGSSLIAHGLQEWKTGKKPNADWYIEDKEAEAEMKQLEISYDMEASNHFQQISASKKSDVGKLLGLPVWNASEKVVNSLLWDFIRKSPQNAKDFIERVSQNNVRFNVEVLVKDAINFNIIRRNRNKEYVFGDVVLGNDLQSAANKLVLGQFADVRAGIQSQLKGKKR